MNNSLVRISRFAALLALGGAALLQASQQATFHLSAVTHWGNAVLQPGDYKMSLPDEALGHRELKVEGNGRTVYVFPIVADSKQRDGSSHLDVKEVNGQYFVNGFTSGVLGKDFIFSMPKSARLQEVPSVAKGDVTSSGLN